MKLPAVFVLMLSGVGACASMTGYQIAYNGEQTGYRPEDTPSIYVLPHTRSVERSLDVDSRRLVENALRQMGYKITTEDKADVYLVVEAWVDEHVQRSTASLIQPASVEVVNDPGRPSRTVRFPERPVSFPVSVNFKVPRMAMMVVDGPEFRKKNEAKVLWRGDTILPKGGLLLNEAIPYLMFPLVTSFGTQSKGIIQVDVSSKQATGFK